MSNGMTKSSLASSFNWLPLLTDWNECSDDQGRINGIEQSVPDNQNPVQK
jgi:hypothetical protein